MISSIQTKLHTNYVPTEEEAACLKKGMEKSDKKLHDLETEIHHLRDRLHDLSKERELLSQKAERYRGFLAPARRLLPEILQEIFYHTLPTTHNSMMNCNEPPLILGRVCRQWRQVAYFTPRLWASIHISTPHDNPFLRTVSSNDDTTFLSAIASWLSRSGVLPLEISFYSSFWSPPNPVTAANARVRPYLHLLAQHAARWKSIHLQIHTYNWTEFFKTFNAADFPLLEKIYIEGVYMYEPPDDGLSFPDLEAAKRESGIFRAPRLRSLSAPRYGHRMLELPVRWGALTQLSLLINSSPALQDITKGLMLCPNLETCSISLSTWDTSMDSLFSLAKITLLRLRTLALFDDTSHYYISCLLENLYAPELLHLAYNRRAIMHQGAQRDYSTRFIRSLALFLGRIHHPLEELDLVADMLYDTEAMKILELVPGLKRLSLKSFGRVSVAYDSPWPPTERFCFEDQQLRKLTPFKVGDPRSEEDVPILGFDHDTIHDADKDMEPLPPLEVTSKWRRPESPLEKSSLEVSGERLCPKLEVFHCTGAMFSHSSLLDFLRSRSVNHSLFGVAHLRRVGISFVSGRKKSDNTIRQIKELEKETGMVVCLAYLPSVVNLPSRWQLGGYSPYEGLEPMADNYFPQAFVPGFK